jgi:hypothetical protein
MTSKSKDFVFPTSEKHDKAPAESVDIQQSHTSEDALDRGIEESFPASDPISVTSDKAVKH